MNHDINLAVIAGRIAAPPESRIYDSGSRSLRYLITCVTDVPRHRTDVIPVTLLDPDPVLVDRPGSPGERIWAAASIQRRFFAADDGRRSRVELLAHHVQIGGPCAEGSDRPQ
jgi:hypothetical protein